MATKEIKQKIVLQGEKEYKQALHDAGRNLKTLKSELKAQTAEMGKNATEQQKAEAKTKSLTAQIKEQEKIVAVHREALEEVKKKYADNADAIAAYEQRLNSARATLGNMRSELEGVGSGFRSAQEGGAAAVVATKSFADSLEKIGGVGDAVSGTIEDIFSGMVSRITAAVGELWSMISETAARADEWSDLAGFWGTDPQRIQQYARAVGSVNDSFGDLSSLVSKIVLGGKGEDIAELLGVSRVNFKGSEWDYAMAVMDALHKAQKEGRDLMPVYETLFGAKPSQKAMDLVNDWADIQGKLGTFNGDEGGFGMSSEDLSTMQDVQLMITDIGEKWEALKDKFAAGFGKVTLDLGINVSGALDGLNDFMNAGTPADREAALEQIRKNVEELCRKIGEAIRAGLQVLGEVGESLQGSEDPVTRAIGDILSALTDSLEWMINNQEAVKGAFEAIFGVWLIAKLAAVAGKLSTILAQIKVIQAFKGLSAATTAAQTAGDAAAEAGAGAAGGGGAVGLLGLVKAAIPNLLVAWGTWELSKLIPADWITKLTGGTAAEVGEIQRKNGIETVGDAMNQVAANPEQSKKSLGLMWEALTNPTAGTKKDVAEEVAEAVDEGIQESMTAAQAQALEAFWDAWRADELAGHTDESQEGLVSAWDAYEAAFAGQEGLYNKVDELLTRFQEGAGSGWTGIEDLPADFWQNAGGVQSGGISSADLAGFRSVPAAMAAAVQRGAAEGVSGISVQLDGERVGQLVAPYVSQGIATQIAALGFAP